MAKYEEAVDQRMNKLDIRTCDIISTVFMRVVESKQAVY